MSSLPISIKLARDWFPVGSKVRPKEPDFLWRLFNVSDKEYTVTSHSTHMSDTIGIEELLHVSDVWHVDHFIPIEPPITHEQLLNEYSID